MSLFFKLSHHLKCLLWYSIWLEVLKTKLYFLLLYNYYDRWRAEDFFLIVTVLIVTNSYIFGWWGRTKYCTSFSKIIILHYVTIIYSGPKFQRVQIVKTNKQGQKSRHKASNIAVCSLKNIALINTDLDAPKISRSHIVFAYNSLYVPHGGKNPVHLSICKLRRNTGHFFSISATDLLVMHLEGEDRWRESAFRFLVTCNVIAHSFGSYNSPRAHMRKPLSARHKYCNTASEWALTHARQLFCPVVWFNKNIADSNFKNKTFAPLFIVEWLNERARS